MDRRPKDVDYSDPQWIWPCWKFNLRLDDLFNNLYDQYNTFRIPILEPVAFHHDVAELCSIATTLDEFHALMKGRRKQRIKELQQCWDAVSLRIASWPPSLEGDPATVARRWAAFLHFSREFSFDTLNRYFSLFTHHEQEPSPPSLPPLASPTSPSQYSRHTSPSTTIRTGTAPTQSRKRKTSLAANSVGDKDDEDEHGRKSKKLRPSNEAFRNRHVRRTSFNRTGATEQPSSERLTPISTSSSVKSGSPHTVRRSFRIAERTQEQARRQKPEAQIRGRSQAANNTGSRQSASTTTRRV